MTEPVVIVEDHALLADTVGLALRAEGLSPIMAPLTDRLALLDTVAAAGSCLVLLDLDLGPLGDGVTLIPAMVERGSRVLVVTGVRDELRLAGAVAAGALGFVRKDAPLDVLVETVQRVLAGVPVLDAQRRQELLAGLRRHEAERAEIRAPFQALTTRERHVLAALADGKSVDRIATEAFVSRNTVRSQVRSVLAKLDVGTQLAAVAKARRAGWLR